MTCSKLRQCCPATTSKWCCCAQLAGGSVLIEMTWTDNSPLLNAFDPFLLSLSYPSSPSTVLLLVAFLMHGWHKATLSFWKASLHCGTPDALNLPHTSMGTSSAIHLVKSCLGHLASAVWTYILSWTLHARLAKMSYFWEVVAGHMGTPWTPVLEIDVLIYSHAVIIWDWLGHLQLYRLF